MRTAIYLRISEDRMGLELGVDRQREDCVKLAQGRGWSDLAEFVDNDISATTGRLRPGYRDLMAAVAAGTMARVIVWHQSRIWRNRRERADGIETLRQAKASLISVKGPELDMATAAGRGMAGLLGEFDTWESEVKSERSVREARQRAELGGHHGGPRPFGYTSDGMALEETEAANLKRWYAELLAGRSITSIAKEAGKHHSSMWCILTNERNAGLRFLAGEEFAGKWPAIVSEATWRAAHGLLTDPARRTNTSNVARRWLGTGLYQCARCDGHPVKGGHAGKANGGYHRYRCVWLDGGCSRSWHGEKLDTFIVELVTARLSKGDLAGLLPSNRPDLEQLRTERRNASRKLDTLAEDWAVGDLTKSQLQAATAKLRARIAEIDGKLGQPVTPADASGVLAAADPAAAWLAIPADQVARRQAVVRALMTVRLNASPRGRAKWDPRDFIDIRWNDGS